MTHGFSNPGIAVEPFILYFPNLNPEIFGPNPVSSPTHSITYRSLDLLAASLPPLRVRRRHGCGAEAAASAPGIRLAFSGYKLGLPV